MTGRANIRSAARLVIGLLALRNKQETEKVRVEEKIKLRKPSKRWSSLAKFV